MPIPLWYSNQDTIPRAFPVTQETGPSPFDCTSAVHEYRIDWTAEFTAFYLDGELQRTFTTNIPSEPGPWVWNNWANGDIGTYRTTCLYLRLMTSQLMLMMIGWSVGPPASDSVFRIQDITMYYNTSMGGGSGDSE